MIGIRHEEYAGLNNSLPFILNCNINRTAYICSAEKNWHEDLEIQFCTDGKGTVILNGKNYPFNKNDIIVVEPNVIHYTGTDSTLTYTCLIISPIFFKNMGIDLHNLQFPPIINNPKIAEKLGELFEIYNNSSSPLKIAMLNLSLLDIVIELTKNHSTERKTALYEEKDFEKIKAVIKYIRKNYSKKITLSELAEIIYMDKYTLCRNFKKFTGQTVTHYINNYRCQMAADCISQGLTVAEASHRCGFENLSFFTKTFKKHMGILPSKYKHI